MAGVAGGTGAGVSIAVGVGSCVADVGVEGVAVAVTRTIPYPSGRVGK